MKTRSMLRPRVALLPVLIATALAQPLYAQDVTPEPATEDEDTTELSGVEVEGSYTEGGQELYTDERRATASVSEAVSAEQIARTGDSDAASTLKRVTGLSVVDGRYVFVRGLGDRYSSVLLNGAQIPSPDPTRRVVPLDLFPNELLEGVVIQKSYSAELPGEFGGGSVQLRTRGAPVGFVAKLGFGVGYDSTATFDDGLGYDGGSSDWTGYDDGAREMPEALAQAIADGTVLRPISQTNPTGFNPAELEGFGEALAGQGYAITARDLKPNSNLSGAIGNRFELGDVPVGVLAAVRYANNQDHTDEVRNTYAVLGDGALVQSSGLDVARTTENTELSAFLSSGAEFGENHRIKNTTMLLRSTEDEAKITSGYTEDPADVSRFHSLEWIENELRATQLAGEHRFPAARDLSLNWQYTLAQATRESPNTRNYRYDRNNSTEQFQFSRRSDSNSTVFSDLVDDSQDFGFAFKLPLMLNDETYLDLSAGGGMLRRERESEIRRFEFSGVGPLANDPRVISGATPDEIFTPDNIGATGFQLREVTRGTDNYEAEQDLDALFIAADLNWKSVYRFMLGLRHEANDQEVSTFALGSTTTAPTVARISSDDLLPSAAFTWLYSDAAQWRLTYSETVSRPDFRELSPAPYTDPLLDLETIGNPDLKPTAIQHLDLRWEYYFSYSESFSAALFLKDFSDPIEKIQVPGTGSLLSLANADSASNRGIELDYFRGLEFLGERWTNFYGAANYAWIDSEIDLGGVNDIQTNDQRPMQGQSPYVANLQFGYRTPANDLEATLLYNVFGKRISQVGVFGAPDIYEQDFHSLDFNLRKSLDPEWTLKLRLRNLLDPKVEFTQGDEITREFRRGRELGLTLEWRPQD
ncbi:MAG TPA: TonB-dependent receptor [Patescibacteria group bacterium]|nr:TonB-dependent receptor [Patescibacteria group bacterium]